MKPATGNYKEEMIRVLTMRPEKRSAAAFNKKAEVGQEATNSHPLSPRSVYAVDYDVIQGHGHLSGRCEMDSSHADICVARSNCVVLEFTGQAYFPYYPCFEANWQRHMTVQLWIKHLCLSLTMKLFLRQLFTFLLTDFFQQTTRQRCSRQRASSTTRT
jgi:hypothetical protein